MSCGSPREKAEAMTSEFLFIPARACAEMLGWGFLGFMLALGGKTMLYRGGDFLKKLWRDAGTETP